MRILWQIFHFLKNVRNMMANLGFLGLGLSTVFFHVIIHVLA
jgi:hypothetical protein